MYRARQFSQALLARPLPPQAWREIEEVLTAEELALFRRYSVPDRQHAYRVMSALRQAGHNHPNLLAAALLHDVGKTRFPLRIWERVLGSLAEMLIPGRLAALAAGPPRFWRRPFLTRAKHAQWGADMAAAAGSDPLTVELIRRHQDKALRALGPETARLLTLLQLADDSE